MTIKPTKRDLLDANESVRGVSPQFVSDGKINEGKIQSIAEKPFREFYGTRRYDTIFKQAACLMEGIIRLHPFPDGNKRTALLTTVVFLRVNGYYLAIPLDTVRFLVSIARDESRNEEEIDVLINRIATWLEERTASSKDKYGAKEWKYVSKPLLMVLLLALTGVGCFYVGRKFGKWMAVDMHPEYKKSIPEILRFVLALQFRPARDK